MKLTKVRKVAFRKKWGSLCDLLKCYHGAKELNILKDVQSTLKTSSPLFLKSHGATIYNMLFARINAYSVEVADFFDSVRLDIEGLESKGHFHTNPTMVDIWVMKFTVFAREAEKEKGLEYFAAAKEMFNRLLQLQKSGQTKLRR